MTTVISTIFVLGILIFVHELGHFLVAKWVGIRVEKFSLGFPPKLIGFRIGETEYCISIIPLGGYVKMAGESPDQSEVTGAPYEFMSKSPSRRAMVIVAGPLMNYVAAFLIYTMLFMIQGDLMTYEDKAVIGYVAEDSPAEVAGILEDDEIISINGTAVSSFEDLSEMISPKIAEEVTIELRRESGTHTMTLTTALDSVMQMSGQWKPVGRIGVGQKHWWEPIGAGTSIRRGAERTWEMTSLIFGFLYKLLTGQISPKMMGGPLFIAEVSGEAARIGMVALFEFIAMLSVNLAILNILPIPVLDGGHLGFLGIEVLRRRPLSLKQRAVVQQVGLAFLLFVMVFITYNDIIRWLSR
jgi:regulator of sigma E protease